MRFCAENNKQEILATALLAEMDKPKVWDGAPENANEANIYFQHREGVVTETVGSAIYTRELPKSRERVIAEEAKDRMSFDKLDIVDIIEDAILKAKEEWEAGEAGE